MTQLEAALAQIVATIAAVIGIKQVPVNPPDTVNVDTFAIVYAKTGDVQNGVLNARLALHNIGVDVLTKRTDLARDLARVKPFVDLIPAALLADVSFGGTVQTFGSVSYEFFSDEYAGVPVIGYRFTINNMKIIT